MSTYRMEAAAFLRAHPEVHRFRARRIAGVIAKMVLTAALCIALTVFLYVQTPHAVIIVIGAFLGVAAVYYVGKPHVHFRQKHLTVTQLEQVSKYMKTKKSATHMAETTVLNVTCLSSDGVMQTIEVPPHYHLVLQENDTVLFISGIPYLIDPTPHTHVVCPYCGNVMPTPSAYCVDCKKHNPYYKRSPDNPS